MKQSLKKALTDKFDEIKLNDSQLTTLIGSNAPSDKPDRYLPTRKIAACFALILALVCTSFLYQGHQSKNLLRSIASEAVNNHLKRRPLEIESQNLVTVMAYFTELDFNLLQTSDLNNKAGSQLLGGRYCSINGIIAAQFRVLNSDGSISTLYQGILPESQLKRVPDTVNGETPSVYYSKGIEAEIWRYQGVVFVKVTDL